MLKFSVRYTFIQIRILEQLRRFKEIPNILLRMTNVENNIPFLQPLPFEKASFYFLVDEASIMHKKFCFFQYLAAMNYFNQTIDLKKYSLNCFYMISSFFQSKDQSYLKIKEHLYSTMADIALKNNKFENSSYFYANSIVLSLYKQNNEEQQDRFLKRFLKSVKEDEKKISPSEDSSVVGIDEGVTFSSKFLIKELRFPQIINSSLISFEEQDVNLLKYKGWNYFNKFNSFDVNYVNISDSDMIVLKNLDFLADNKLFKNEKKKFKSTVNSKIYIKIMIKNPLAIALTINSIKLITQYSDNFNCNENVELEELSVKLKPYSSNFISLSVTPLKCGNIKIVGLEVSILGIASFKSFFMDIDNRDENNLYKEVIQNKEKYPLIEYNIIDADNDIAINFLNSQINLFQYQFGTVSVRITNKSKQMVIKKFSIFFDSSDVFISNYLHFDMKIDKQQEVIIDIPLCPQISGKFKSKIIFKFEEEIKIKEIEIKRSVISIEVLPLLSKEVKEIVKYSDNSYLKISLNTKFSYSNSRIKSLINEDYIDYSLIDTKNFILYGANSFLTDQKFKDMTSSFTNLNQEEGPILKTEYNKVVYNDKNLVCHYCDYNLFKPNQLFNFKKDTSKSGMIFNSSYSDKSVEKIINLELNYIKELFYSKTECLETTKSKIKSEAITGYNLIEYLPYEKLYESILNSMSASSVFIVFDAIVSVSRDKDSKDLESEVPILIKCGFIYNVYSKRQLNDKTYLLDCIKNNISLAISYETIGDISLIKIDLKILPLFESLGVTEYEFITRSDQDISWLGVKKHSIKRPFSKNSKGEKKYLTYDRYETHDIVFTCTTTLKNFVNLNKISLVLYQDIEELVSLDTLPCSMTIYIN